MRISILKSDLESLIKLLKTATQKSYPQIASAVTQFACVSANGHIEEF